MKKFFVCEVSKHANHAGSKARDDIRDILISLDWTPLMVHRGEDGSTIDKFSALWRIQSDWMRIIEKAHPCDIVFIQYPLAMYPKVSLSVLPWLCLLRAKGVRLLFFIHDLDGLRGLSGKCDKGFLSNADGIISHNAMMTKYLRGLGLTCPIVNLGLFDYLAKDVSEESPDYMDYAMRDVIIAGNLSLNKAGYVYCLGERFPESSFRLYGPNFDARSESSKWYMGSFPPDELPKRLKGSFGLVWDGDSTESCSGEYGEYLKMNNPHKMSLYLAAGLPIIIWNQAAQAAFVDENNAGITVRSIGEALTTIQSLSPERMQEMRRNARNLSKKVREGEFTRAALTRILVEMKAKS